MPLTREQTRYQTTSDTVFLPTVAIDNNLAVRGTSVFDGNVTVNGNFTPALFTYNGPLSGTTLSLSGAITSTNTTTTSRNTHTFQNSPGSVFSIRSHGPSYVETLLGNSLSGNTLLISTSGDLLIGTYVTNNLILGTNNAERLRIDNAGNVGIAMTPTFKFDITGAALGTTSGNQSQVFRLTTTSSNADYLEITNTRTANGADWTTAGYRIQEKIDATWMAYIQFNGSSGSNQGGISFGTGTTTASPTSITERVRISGDSFGTTTFYGNVIQNVNATAKTTNYQLTTADANTIVQMNGAFAFQVDTSLAVLPLGTTITLVAQTTGVTVATTANATVPTVNATPGLKLRAAWSTATLIKMSAASASGTASTWLLTGDLTA